MVPGTKVTHFKTISTGFIKMAEQAAKSKQKKVHALHQKIKVLRDADPLTSVFMWGVNFMVIECACKFVSFS